MLIYFVIVPVLLAIIMYLLHFEKAGKYVVIVSQVALLVAAFYLLIASRESPLITIVGGYESLMGIVLRADAVSAVFVLLTALLFLIAVIYSFYESHGRLYWLLMLIWQGLLNGIFLSGDFFNLFVLVEVATVLVTIMLLYDKKKRSMYDGLFYLMTNIFVVQFYLFGIGYLYRLTGVMDMETARLAISFLDSGQLLLPYALIMTFLIFKCAQVPLFSWLPKAYGTDGIPVSALAILSGVHIKSSLYLFIRFQSVFENVLLVFQEGIFFLALGSATALFGILMALAQRDIRLILAYSSVAQMGLLIVGFSIGGVYTDIGSLYHMLNHALLKAGLFLSVGVIAKAYGSYNINEIRGLFKCMPFVSVATILMILGMTGAPLLNGSISKYLIMYELEWPLFALLLLINTGTIIVFVKYAAMFFGKTAVIKAKIENCKAASLFALGLLALAGGIFGEWSVSFLFNVEVYISPWGYLEKVGIFAASCFFAFFLYKDLFKRSHLLKRLEGFELGFRGACASIGIFFGIILLSLN